MKKLLVIVLTISSFLLVSCKCSNIIKTAKDYAQTNKSSASYILKALNDVKCKEGDKSCLTSVATIKVVIKALQDAAEKILNYKKKD